MKKILSSLLLASATVMMFGQVQVIVNENFNSLTAGNLGTQNSWLTSGGVATDYQVAAIDTAHGLSLTTTSGNGYVATSNPNNRTAARITTVVATPANNIVQAKAEIYTGSSNGAGEYRFVVVGTTGTTTVAIGGFTYNVATKKLNGLATFNDAGTPGLFLAVNNAVAPVFPINTWIPVTFTYNKTNGAMTWAWPGGGTSVTTETYQIAGMVAKDVYVQNLTATGNTTNNTLGVDNILAQFGNSATLSVSDVNTVKADRQRLISISPNPTSDILNIKTDSKIIAVSVVDMTGRKVNVQLEGNQVDVRELPVGNYLINIETKDGIATEKFIKK